MIEMIGDNWSGSRSGVWRIAAPDADHIHAAIRALDGESKSSLTLAIADPYRQLTVAGGPTQLVVSGELPDGSIIDLTNPDADPDPAPVELVCGGNRARFDPSQVVSVDRAIEAIDEFLADFPNGISARWQVS